MLACYWLLASSRLSLNHNFFACESHLLVFSTNRKARNERPRNRLAVPSGFRDVSGIMYVSCIIHYDFEKTIFNFWFLDSYLFKKLEHIACQTLSWLFAFLSYPQTKSLLYKYFELLCQVKMLWSRPSVFLHHIKWCRKRNHPVRCAYRHFLLSFLLCTCNVFAGYILKCFTMPWCILFQSGKKKCQSNPKEQLNR